VVCYVWSRLKRRKAEVDAFNMAVGLLVYVGNVQSSPSTFGLFYLVSREVVSMNWKFQAHERHRR